MIIFCGGVIVRYKGVFQDFFEKPKKLIKLPESCKDCIEVHSINWISPKITVIRRIEGVEVTFEEILLICCLTSLTFEDVSKTQSKTSITTRIYQICPKLG